MPTRRHPRYAELRCKTNFSFLCGASHAEELVARAAELQYDALAVTDVNSLAGIVRAHAAAKTHGVKLVIGAELTVDDAPSRQIRRVARPESSKGVQPEGRHTPFEDSGRATLYAPDRLAYGRLARLIIRGRRAAEKGSCHIIFDDV